MEEPKTKSVIGSEEFASVIAHQLREPATSIRWFTEILMRETAGRLLPEQQSLLGFLHESSNRLVYVLDLLLRLSRVESGRLQIQPTQVDIYTVAGEVAKTLESIAQARGITVQITKSDNLPPAFLDRTILFEIIQNLLSNAIRYSPDNDTVSVQVETTDASFEISISDKGIGIPEGEKGQIFQKFFRASNARAAVPGGTGLGLALVRALVQESGGNVSFSSKAGEGATFTVSLPKTGMKSKSGSVQLTEPVTSAKAVDQGPKTVFVIEDDEFLSRAYKYIFEKSGYTVWLSRGLMDALGHLESAPPDVVLLDLMLPDGSGYSFMSGMHEKPGWQNVPVVILTNLGTQEDIDKGNQLGAADFLVKANMDVEGILQRVERVLKK